MKLIITTSPHKNLTMMQYLLLPLLTNRDTHNKHQTTTLTSKRPMPHPGFPVRISALLPSPLQMFVVQVPLSHVNLLNIVMHENVLLVARAGLPALQGCSTACLGLG